MGSNPAIAFAICYEISVPAHLSHVIQSGGSIYIASVAKSESGVKDAVERLSHIASQYSMPVLMSNCIGPSGGFLAAGSSSIWNRAGILAAQLNERDEGILLIDTETDEIIEKYLGNNLQR
jgi:predicted amidohydrolase